jgi:anti-sigma-K factor RskA|uniref:anti-sigma factor n=1 Tax=Cephaloticoccus sp. TaxID=1985742 RepID=UPI00404A0682
MITEHQEELACLYVFGLLEGAELAAFETLTGQDIELQHYVDGLRETANRLAHIAPEVDLPPQLKERILNQVIVKTETAKVIPFRPMAYLGWAAAACFALVALWAGRMYTITQTENSILRQQQELADTTLRSLQNQSQSELILTAHELDDAKRQIAELNLQLQDQADLARFKIAALTSLLGNSPEAIAVAVWNPDQQQGVLSVEKLPALAANQDYQLWVVDPQYPIPVDGGVFQVDPVTGHARIKFHANKPIKTVAKFAVSLERKGGVPKAEGPMVLLSQ